MREIFTYGSVGGALGNQCFYPEGVEKDPLLTPVRCLHELQSEIMAIRGQRLRKLYP